MKTELKITLAGKEDIRYIRKEEDREKTLGSSLQSLLKDCYVIGEKIFFVEGVTGKKKSVLSSHLKIKDGSIVIPTEEVMTIAKNAAQSTGSRTDEFIQSLLEDENTLIASKLAFEVPFTLQEAQVKEKVFEIGYIEAIIDGKHYKGKGESYIIERDE